MSALTPVFSTNLISAKTWATATPAVNQNKAITLLSSVPQKKQNEHLMQASLRLSEIMERLKSKDSSEYRSLKSLLKSKQSAEILLCNVAALDKKFQAHNQRHPRFLRCLINVALYVANVFRSCFGFTKLDIDCKRIDMNQFSKIVNQIYQEHIHSDYSIDISDNQVAPAEQLSPANIAKLELGQIPSLNFTFAGNTFLLFFDKETDAFFIEIFGPLQPMSVLRQDERLKDLKAGERADLNSTIAIIEDEAARRQKFLVRAVQASKTDNGNLEFSYPANRILIERGRLYSLKVGTNHTLRFGISPRVS